jgi:hypothetical protein
VSGIGSPGTVRLGNPTSLDTGVPGALYVVATVGLVAALLAVAVAVYAALA